MGFDINEITTTDLHYKDICVILMMYNQYEELQGKDADSEVLQRMKTLVNRLGAEMYNFSEDSGRAKKLENELMEFAKAIVTDDTVISMDEIKSSIMPLFRDKIGLVFDPECMDEAQYNDFLSKLPK